DVIIKVIVVYRGLRRLLCSFGLIFLRLRLAFVIGLEDTLKISKGITGTILFQFKNLHLTKPFEAYTYSLIGCHHVAFGLEQHHHFRPITDKLRAVHFISLAIHYTRGHVVPLVILLTEYLGNLLDL